MASLFSVKELFYTLQGEGAQSGRGAVFCRFAGCNLWSGREEDRARAICQFCDTDFVGTDGPGGGQFTGPEALAQAISETWQLGASDVTSLNEQVKPYVVFTGGEPMLQLTEKLVQCLHELNFEVAIETNGTLPVPVSVDWICVSPKFGSELKQARGQELKVVVPQLGQNLEALAKLPFKHFFLQPMHTSSDKQNAQNLQKTIQLCMRNPQWRLSLQTHKAVGIP